MKKHAPHAIALALLLGIFIYSQLFIVPKEHYAKIVEL